MPDQWIINIVFVLYIGAMLGIGLIGYRQTDTLLDYLLGGRRISTVVAALSACASDMSGWLLMGLPGAVFVAGLSEAWIGLGLLAGSYLNWLMVAKRLRLESERLGAITISDYFELRFADGSRSLRLITAGVILVFFLIYTISGLVAGGKLFEGVFGLDYRLAVVIGTFVIIVYTTLGGFFAVSLTDAVQGLLMLCALLIVPWLTVTSLGGWAACIHQLTALSPNLLTFFENGGGAIAPMTIISTLGWGLGYFGMPHILVRFMAIEHAERIPRARRIAVAWTALSLVAAIGVGLAGIAYFHGQAIQDSEKVFILLIQQLFHPIPAGFCLAAILAAIMSTADSQLLVCSSVITEDLYRTFFNREAEEKELIFVGRLAVAIIAVIAAAIAFDNSSKIMDLVSYAWAGFGAAFGPAIVMSLYWRKMSTAGAISGILGGGITVVVWKNLSGGLFDLYEILPGFLISLLLIVLFSYWVPGRVEAPHPKGAGPS